MTSVFVSFVIQVPGIAAIAPHAAFGAFYFLISTTDWRLPSASLSARAAPR